MKLDLRRRNTGSPITYIPGLSTTPRRGARVPSRPGRDVQPAVVRAEAGRPEDRPDLAAAQIDLQPRRFGRARRLEALRLADFAPPTPAPSPVDRAHSSKVSNRRFIFRSASANMFRSPPEKSARPSRAAETRPTSSTPIALRAFRSSVVRRACRRAAARADAAHGSDRRSSSYR